MPTPQFTAGLLRQTTRAYAKAAVHELHQVDPDLVSGGLPQTFASPLDDIEVRLLQLAASVEVDRPALLANALRWYKVAFHHRDVPARYLPATLAAIGAALERELPADAAALVRRNLDEASRGLDDWPVDVSTHLSKSAPHGELSMRFLLANLEGRGEDAIGLLRQALADGVSVADVHDHVLTPAQREAGRMWLMGEIPIADEHYGSAIAERALWMLQEHLPKPPEGAPRVMTLGVGGNLHELGLRMVAQRLQIAGFAVHHLGANMPASDMEWAFQDRPVELIAISATMALHLHSLIELVAAVRAALVKVHGNAHARPILVGGEPFRSVPDLYRIVGADASASDAVGAVQVAQRLVANLL